MTETKNKKFNVEFPKQFSMVLVPNSILTIAVEKYKKYTHPVDDWQWSELVTEPLQVVFSPVVLMNGLLSLLFVRDKTALLGSFWHMGFGFALTFTMPLQLIATLFRSGLNVALNVTKAINSIKHFEQAGAFVSIPNPVYGLGFPDDDEFQADVTEITFDGPETTGSKAPDDTSDDFMQQADDMMSEIEVARSTAYLNLDEDGIDPDAELWTTSSRNETEVDRCTSGLNQVASQSFNA